ncbi:hypothetical protein BGZ61DRAFT_134876 [Ilyonectria robusta]|uniref:uncharacterized protein n=1 Tax=Ilyonectria robusta TaxID=1079257 RepID=UPI001E8DF652|nr:uncharacterized protein BGZ61DRAFT_134876 [Ilyonectria robusta]KAH8735082.1 hypothetical protein BGZ61DRAFT_134876 [Ilyonectria robusta]
MISWVATGQVTKGECSPSIIHQSSIHQLRRHGHNAQWHVSRTLLCILSQASRPVRKRHCSWCWCCNLDACTYMVAPRAVLCTGMHSCAGWMAALPLVYPPVPSLLSQRIFSLPACLLACLPDTYAPSLLLSASPDKEACPAGYHDQASYQLSKMHVAWDFSSWVFRGASTALCG